MKIKVCGITNPHDAESAIECGADYIGLVFIEGTPRCIDQIRAQAIASVVAGRAKIVGVFQDQPFDLIDKAAKEIPLDLVQLHGSESPDVCDKISVPVIKAFSPEFGLEQSQSFVERFLDKIELYRAHCQHVLIDKRKFIESDWLTSGLPNVARVESKLGNYFLAGGLNEEKLGFVLETVNPFCLDISSGIETSPGKKDLQLMMQFFSTVRHLTHKQALGEAKTC